MPQLSVVIPAYNEEHTVAGVVRAHADMGRKIATGCEVLVCDDGSTDGTWRVLETVAHGDPSVKLLRNGTNLGIPATMKRLYAAAGGDWIYFTAADGQVPDVALEVMWAAREGQALVVGRRVPRRDPLTRVLIAEVYSAGLRAVFRLPVRDVDSVKLYRGADLRAIDVRSRSNFFEAELLITLCRRRRPVTEVVVPHRPRIAGRAKGVTLASAALAIRELLGFMVADLFRARRGSP
ncbi:MAG TPA: glycosyltransferase family 2 protein [Candidatus Limnocylindria bacterium]|jgi:glycosyltransferase involved in cell wall biosynthesis|nr:glycosyltransferase family 2 protein [Candidatus Limnocylindria bacterium]